MSDKNIEVIKAIKATGECPKTATIKLTQVGTESLEVNFNEETKSQIYTLNTSLTVATKCVLCDDIIQLDNYYERNYPYICPQCKVFWKELKTKFRK